MDSDDKKLILKVETADEYHRTFEDLDANRNVSKIELKVENDESLRACSVDQESGNFNSVIANVEEIERSAIEIGIKQKELDIIDQEIKEKERALDALKSHQKVIAKELKNLRLKSKKKKKKLFQRLDQQGVTQTMPTADEAGGSGVNLPGLSGMGTSEASQAWTSQSQLNWPNLFHQNQSQ